MKKAYIHIGTHKTGTTALQKWCYLNSEKLLQQHKVFYPKTFSNGDGHHKLARNLSADINKRRNMSDNTKDYELSNSEIRKNLFQGREHTENVDIMISSEIFSLIKEKNEIERLKDIFKDYDIQIVVYMRNMVERIFSSYGERVKGFRIKLDQPIEKSFSLKRLEKIEQLSDRYTQIERWAKIFGKDKVVVLPYIREEMVNGDIVHDFVKKVLDKDIDINSDFKKLSKEDKNINPDPARIEVLRRLNKFNIFDTPYFNERQEFINRVASTKLIYSPNKKLLLYKRKYFEQVIKKFHKNESKLVNKYLPKHKEHFLNLPDGFKYYEELSVKEKISLKLEVNLLTIYFITNKVLKTVRDKIFS